MDSIKKAKLASNGEDFLSLALRIARSDKNDQVKIAGLINIIENVHMTLRRLNGEWNNEPKGEIEKQTTTKGDKENTIPENGEKAGLVTKEREE